MSRIRPLQFDNLLVLQGSAIPSHYLNQLDFQMVKEKKHLITLLRLLVYVSDLNYEVQSLRAKFRHFQFPLRDFLQFNNQSSSSYQLNKLKEFFDLVRQNFVIESFYDSHYRMLVTIPEVYLDQDKIGSELIVDIWIAEELFDYFHPFLFPEFSKFFDERLNDRQFQVAFEIIKNFSSHDVRKEFDIQKFLDQYPSKLNGSQKKEIKIYFGDYLRLLEKEGKIHHQVLDLSKNRFFNIQELNTSH